ncbi:peptidoglycan DD-metalloendopeptidase family protein [Intestinimonas massiliensis]|uniref:Peptidoglycan DD-metalloendopeptidase family protein n=1 Tax=Intestinimonas massiliensis (ex Afouda et al. 2020) TaxID=1673721 RepID=A0ABS9MBB3_9FIRM|nr:M23 family metallopeptidase [Intestinimonas massiliensis (ex Afouda et al. 2020)]MCG4528099.1 peptidoglycan DD-metalloendopeptidase family protein [Intestinimonas massiliensis (ex Afouda et al. 2020)]MCQ4807220.1 peptidoglycan DD-metalloendopeptidase family protein [Intestinimonas massiliensis (ex Afouda et al. 2020)]
MKKRPFVERIGDFMAGKGFYIVLFLCVAAIGISGYYLFSSLNLGDGGNTAVAGPIQVVVTPSPSQSATPQPVKPSVSPQASPSPGTAAPATMQPSGSPAVSASPAPAQTPAAPTVFTWPVKGEVIADYSLEVLAYDETMGDWRTHSGLDIAASLGTEVLAVAAGTVASIEDDVLMGTTIVVDHGDGLKSVYANLAAIPSVQVGDAVQTGAVLGAVGDTAAAEAAKAPHLHFEMIRGDEPVDPASFLPQHTP